MNALDDLSVLAPGSTSFPSRAAWFDARRSGLGGSDSVKIALHEGEYALWADKMGLLSGLEEEQEREDAHWGKVLEAPIREQWELREGLVATPCANVLIRDVALPFLVASPDALVGEDAGLEIKNRSEWKAGDWKNDVPLDVQVQCQHYLGVTGRARWHVAALIGGNRLIRATLDRNERFITALRAELSAWWDLHIIRKIAPEPDASDSTSETIRRAFRTEIEGEAIEFPDDFAELHLNLREAKAAEKKAKADIDGLENKIKATIGSASRGVLPGGIGEYTWATQKREEYVVKATTFRVLRFHKGEKSS